MLRSGYKNITRINDCQQYGWQVDVYFQKKNYSKFFSDFEYDGPSDTLQAAIQYIEENVGQFTKLPPKAPVGELVYLAGGSIDETTVSIRFFGEQLDPDKLTEWLGYKPSYWQYKGDVIFQGQYRKIAKEGCWILSTERDNQSSLEEKVTSLLDKLADDKKLWQELTTQFRVDVFCGIFMQTWNRGFELSPQVMNRLAERNVVIGFDIYYEGEDEEDVE